ncbi:mycothiol synthase [Haloglycomyces albus]|uniref:mycothiol synthase n=1 Tax=Haloglycomyces albus TaxID=526067 RepID=UPI00046C9EC1|nr:mycothiol synthase [Haloglycomyces albus]
MAQVESLSDDQVRGIKSLASRCQQHDGAEPFNEETLLSLTKIPGPHLVHFLIGSSDHTIGYAQLTLTDGEANAEMAVDPRYRRQGHGRRLMEDLVSSATNNATVLRLWSHGDGESARRVAESEGFRRSRVLFELGIDSQRIHWPRTWPEGAGDWPTGNGPRLSLPDGMRLRAFEPGNDESELVRVNAAAFAAHPEQGQWTFEDVITREQEEWFDSEGVILAEGPDGVVGFHFTKMIPEDGETPVGEIYVLGIDPEVQGSGLGRILTWAGMGHMAARGAKTITLFVDESNEPAVRLYRSQGFETVRTDVQYSRPLSLPA